MMILSIGGLIHSNGFKVSETIYEGCSEEFLKYKIVSGNFYEAKVDDSKRNYFRYKNCVDAVPFSFFTEAAPKMCSVKFPHIDEIPFFTSGFKNMGEALLKGRKIAIEGGPCLFGTNEVVAVVKLKGGLSFSFDYNTGKSYEKFHEGETFPSFLEEKGDMVEDIDFISYKEGITSQEYDSILYLFEAAYVLDAVLVIPLPDMSYVKYLKAVLQTVDLGIRESVIDKFREVTYTITDMYIEFIRYLSSSYPKVEYYIVHERNQELLRKYYENRAPHIERNRVIRTITGIPCKLESIKDYISMPALPYYLFGIRDILEIDSLDETDSYRKCRKAHKQYINLSCILYPERLSSDNKNTIFNAERKYKEYVY